MEPQTQKSSNVVVVNELSLIAEKSKLKKLKQKLIKKLIELEDKENLDIDEINKITKSIENIDKLLKCMENNGNGVNEVIVIPKLPDRAINTKEDIQVLKALTLGNEEFEDWQMIRKMFRVGIIKLLFAIPEDRKL